MHQLHQRVGVLLNSGLFAILFPKFFCFALHRIGLRCGEKGRAVELHRLPIIIPPTVPVVTALPLARKRPKRLELN